MRDRHDRYGCVHSRQHIAAGRTVATYLGSMMAQMPADRTETMTVACRCSCGAMLQIDPLYGGRCDQCGQWHDAVIVSESLSDELNASVDVDELLQMAAEAEANPEDPLIGQRLGHFLIVARL